MVAGLIDGPSVTGAVIVCGRITNGTFSIGGECLGRRLGWLGCLASIRVSRISGSKKKDKLIASLAEVFLLN